MKYRVYIMIIIILSSLCSYCQIKNDTIYYRPLQFELSFGFASLTTKGSYNGQSLGLSPSGGVSCRYKFHYYFNPYWSAYLLAGGVVTDYKEVNSYPDFITNPNNTLYIVGEQFDIPYSAAIFEAGASYSIWKGKWELRPSLGFSLLLFQCHYNQGINIIAKEKGSNKMEFAGLYFHDDPQLVYAITPRISFLRHTSHNFTWIFDVSYSKYLTKMPAYYYREDAYNHDNRIVKSTKLGLADFINISVGFAIKFGHLKKVRH